MLQFDFNDSLGFWVCSTSHAFRRALNAELAKEGITYRQWEVLARIAMQGELSQSELADCLGIEAPKSIPILREELREMDLAAAGQGPPVNRRRELRLHSMAR